MKVSWAIVGGTVCWPGRWCSFPSCMLVIGFYSCAGSCTGNGRSVACVLRSPPSLPPPRNGFPRFPVPLPPLPFLPRASPTTDAAAGVKIQAHLSDSPGVGHSPDAHVFLTPPLPLHSVRSKPGGPSKFDDLKSWLTGCRLRVQARPSLSATQC